MVVVALLVSSPLTDVAPPPPHVRAASPAAHALLIEAVAKSALLNALIARLEASDIVVYVELTSSPEIPIARTKLVAAAAGARFLRVTINAQSAPWDRLPFLAHELQHATEIADDNGVRDDEGIRRLYEKVGYPGGIDKYETVAARDMERRVRLEQSHRASRR
jgi:hypothetical protein